MPDTEQPTWADLTARSPALVTLRDEVATIRDDGTPAYFCFVDQWYGYREGYGVLPKLERIVGPKADTDDDLLRSPGAQIVAEDNLRELVPPCRGYCPCQWT